MDRILVGMAVRHRPAPPSTLPESYSSIAASPDVIYFTDRPGGCLYAAQWKEIWAEGIEMAHYAPGSQTRALLDEKQRLAARLLSQGLTVTQICSQLRCSPYFVRQARERMPVPAEGDHPSLLSA